MAHRVARTLLSLLCVFAITCLSANATSISIPYLFSPNTLIQSSQVNANFSTVASVVNGNLDNANIVAGANINPSKLNLTTPYLNLATTSTALGFGVGQTGDTIARSGIYANGSMQMGSGSAATDIGLRRSAANTIQLYIPNGAGTATFDFNGGNLTNITIVAPTWTGTAAGDTLTLTTPLGTASGGTGSATSSALTVFGGPNTVGASAAANSFKSYDSALIFGGASNTRTLPTTGTLTGEYWHSGNWVQTGSITCNRCRWHVSGTVTINNTLTVGTELAGGPGNLASSTTGFNGMGLGGGYGGLSAAGGGGGHGGAGGAGGVNSLVSKGGATYPLESLLAGSGGGGGANNGLGFAGGDGGGSFYLEATGNILFTAAAAMTATGGTGSGSGANSIACGGGGSGGGIMIRSLGTVTTTALGSITATGGAGGTGAGAAAVLGGGGGGGGIIDICGSTVTNNGTVTAAGGSGGAGSGAAGTAGSAGTVTVNQFVELVRTAN